MRKTRMQKGITLIALIITIIILLILAVVTIGSIKNSNIITYAQNAATEYSTKKDEEESVLFGYESLMEEKIKESKLTYKEGVPIPEGFYYVTGEKDTGLVISDNPLDENDKNGKNGNQFVWIPVEEDINTKGYGLGTEEYREPDIVKDDEKEEQLKKAECTEDQDDSDDKLTSADLKKELTNIYEEMAESVNKYNGFFVGRYETSRNGTNPQSKASTKNETIISVNASSDFDNGWKGTWYSLYALNKKYKTSSVKSSMMWGIQYDAMMDWMGNEANIVIEEYNKERTCGTASKDVIKNVYDLYGNSHEWTLEAWKECRVGHGRDFFTPICS